MSRTVQSSIFRGYDIEIADNDQHIIRKDGPVVHVAASRDAAFAWINQSKLEEHRAREAAR
jgi:hypothetical protein